MSDIINNNEQVRENIQRRIVDLRTRLSNFNAFLITIGRNSDTIEDVINRSISELDAIISLQSRLTVAQFNEYIGSSSVIQVLDYTTTLADTFGRYQAGYTNLSAEQVMARSMRETSNAKPFDAADFVGVNARTLDEHNVDDSARDEADEKGFNCLITGQVMTTPVYDRRHPGVYYERSAIEKHIELKGVNPTTREPMAKSDLVIDRELEGKIDAWLADKIKNTSAPRATM